VRFWLGNSFFHTKTQTYNFESENSHSMNLSVS
jgi:hypothetical protein